MATIHCKFRAKPMVVEGCGGRQPHVSRGGPGGGSTPRGVLGVASLWRGMRPPPHTMIWKIVGFGIQH